MAARCMLFALVLAGCIEPQLTLCADGRACAPNLVCDEVHHSCVMPDQIAACHGQPDLGVCTAASITGLCVDGVCVEPGCGNHVIEVDEQCDDGNHVSGDGCSSDCTSNETCGNGVLDSIAGELCDDGNLVSHDRCNSRCQPETVQWRTYPETPHAHTKLAAFDPARGRLVQVVAPLVWEWDGTAWQVSYGPDVAADVVVYDSTRQRVLGLTSSAVGEWDGTTWTARATMGTGPTQAIQYAAYDSTRQRVVAITGATVWELDPATATWTSAGVYPGFPTASSIAAYDPQRQRVVVLESGGVTREYNGSSWTAVTAGPTASSGWGLTFDATRQALVAIGGYLLGPGATGGISSWTGTAWVDTGASVPPCDGPAVWYDPARGSLGAIYNPGSSGMQTGIVEVTGTTTVDRTPAVPSPEFTANIVYDPIRDHLLLMGSDWPTVWAWNGTWQALQPSPHPATVGAVVFDPARGGVVACEPGGSTWLFDTAWHSLSTPCSTDTNVTLTYDYVDRQAMLVDQAATRTLSADATAWTNLVSQSLGTTLSSAYDNAHQVLTMISGPGAMYELIDGTWQASLSPGNSYSVAPFLHARSLVLVPTQSLVTVTPSSDRVWERVREAWEPVGDRPFKMKSTGKSLITEMPRGRIIIHAFTPTFDGLLLERQYTSTLPDETCAAAEDADGDGLAGCDDPDCWMQCHPACPPGVPCP
ncbi:MAG TPA: DUF4215 domain-containing protein [Kofleriaceae bacterium]|nr:DUF4215 domain-containing protein [Kofleriaceae bacterium]